MLPRALPQVASGSLHRSGPESWHPLIRPRDKKAASTFQGNRDRPGLDLDDTITPADVERGARGNSGLAADLGRDHQTPGWIHGSDHGMKCTTIVSRRSGTAFRQTAQPRDPRSRLPMRSVKSRTGCNAT
jgi:hypothetical protein